MHQHRRAFGFAVEARGVLAQELPFERSSLKRVMAVWRSTLSAIEPECTSGLAGGRALERLQPDAWKW